MEIYVLLNKLSETSDEYKELSNQLSQIESRFRSLSGSLDWKLKSRASLTKSINLMSNQLNNAENILNRHSAFLNNAMNTYSAAENDGQSQTVVLKKELYKSNSSYSFNTVSPEIDQYDETEIEKSATEFAKRSILEVLKKYGKLDINLSLLSSLASIFSKLYDYYGKYKKGINSMPAFMIDTFGTGFKMFSSWSKYVLSYDALLKGKMGLSALKGTNLQKICEYMPVINVPITFIQTGIESYNEYAADGDFSRNDLAETMVDSSVDGLFSVASGFMSLAGPPGIFASIIFDSANSGFDLGEKVSDGIKDWANNAGQKLKNSNGELTPETAIYSALYGVGWAANKVIDFGEYVANGIAEGAKNIVSTISSWF